MILNIHHWLNHKWTYPEMDRMKLFKGYINGVYRQLNTNFLNNLNLSEK